VTIDDETILDLGSELDEILNAPAPEGAVSQKRRFTRITWRVPVVCQQGDEKFGGHVADVGIGGVALEVVRELAPLSFLTIYGEPADAGPIRVRVRWCRPEGDHFRAGTALADSQENLARSWLKAVLVQLGAATATRDRRQQLRVKCSLPVEVAYGRQTQTGWLVDVGGGGCQVHLQSEVPLGRIEVRIGTTAFHGRVVWVAGPAAGVSFEDLDDAQRAQLADLMKRGED
jgi:hypothetical protein